MNFINKPFIFTIGAQKCGTTTLHNLLSTHGDISLPKIKETHYFSMDDMYQKGIKWYFSNFNFKKKILCEVDPSYLFFSKSSSRIKESIKKPKFIVIFRKPLDRALSHYLMSCYRGYEDFSFIDAIKNEEKRLENDKNKFSFIHHSYLTRGNYVSQLDRYFSLFNKSDFLFVKFDDFIKIHEDECLLKSICGFIGIDYKSLQFKLPRTNTKKKIKSTMIRDLLYKETFLKKAAQLAVPSHNLRNKLKNFINLLNSNNYTDNESKQEVDENMKSLPQKYLDWNDTQTKFLSKVSGINLDDWIYSK